MRLEETAGANDGCPVLVGETDHATKEGPIEAIASEADPRQDDPVEIAHHEARAAKVRAREVAPLKEHVLQTRVAPVRASEIHARKIAAAERAVPEFAFLSGGQDHFERNAVFHSLSVNLEVCGSAGAP